MRKSDILAMRTIATTKTPYFDICIKCFINHDEKVCYSLMSCDQKIYVKTNKLLKSKSNRYFFKLKFDRKEYNIYLDECVRV